MKNLLAIIFIFFSVNCAFASEDVVILTPAKVYSLNTPQPINEVLNSINKNNEIAGSEIFETFEAEEDVSTNKLEQKFYNFVNNKVVNNKFSIYSTTLEKEISNKVP